MRFIFKTTYQQDIRVYRHGGDIFWYGLLMLALLVAPAVLDVYYIGELTLMAIFAIAGVGLMLLTGYTGQISLGHAAFFGVGAYTEAVLIEAGWPFLLSFPTAGLLAGAVGVAIGLPALRLTGLYLAIATLAFAFIVEEVLARWESVTHGYEGMPVGDISLLGMEIDMEWKLYYVAIAVLILVMLAAFNILRSPTGRALVAIRDSEPAAQSMGVNLAKYKTLAFAISAAFTGLAGALYAHKLLYISPDAFTIFMSIELLLMVVIGGLGSLHGVVFGAAFIILLPQAIAIFRDELPSMIAEQPGLEAAFFGLILVVVILFEPLGIYGRWLKVKHYFAVFPLYRKATFKRQKSYTRMTQH